MFGFNKDLAIQIDLLDGKVSCISYISKDRSFLDDNSLELLESNVPEYSYLDAYFDPRPEIFKAWKIMDSPERGRQEIDAMIKKCDEFGESAHWWALQINTKVFGQLVNNIRQNEQDAPADASKQRLDQEQATMAMNRLQDALGKTHVSGHVWYEADTDTYNWMGPKSHRHMSMPGADFMRDVAPYLQ
jgi:hypothetical protein